MNEIGQVYKTDFEVVVRMGKLLPATQENKEKKREILKVYIVEGL
jgi:hypothetical protein